MFACGVYPVFPDFLASVEAEARDNVLRLRHHPSLVMLCGNNEDCELCQKSMNTDTDIKDQQILQWDMKQGGDPLPARIIYEKMLPDIINELVEPPIPYWPGSPYGGEGWDTSDATIGDVVSSVASRDSLDSIGLNVLASMGCLVRKRTWLSRLGSTWGPVCL